LNAHKLKGAVRYFDSPHASRQAQELEDMGRDGDLSQAEARLLTLREEMAVFCNQLNAYLAKQPVG
jgi:hypothetical protein